MIQWMVNLFKSTPPPPKWRLVPGRYPNQFKLEKYHKSVGMYLTEAIVRDEQHAEDVIANLERPVKYKDEQ